MRYYTKHVSLARAFASAVGTHDLVFGSIYTPNTEYPKLFESALIQIQPEHSRKYFNVKYSPKSIQITLHGSDHSIIASRRVQVDSSFDSKIKAFTDILFHLKFPVVSQTRIHSSLSNHGF